MYGPGHVDQFWKWTLRVAPSWTNAATLFDCPSNVGYGTILKYVDDAGISDQFIVTIMGAI